MFHHDGEELNYHFWTRPYQNLTFTTLFCIANRPKSIGQYIHPHHLYALTTHTKTPWKTVTVIAESSESAPIQHANYWSHGHLMLSRFTARALIGCRQLTNMPYTESSCWQTSVDHWHALLWRAGTGSGAVWRRSPAPWMARVNGVVGIGVDGVAAGTGVSASAVFTTARPRRHSHQTPVTWIEGWRLWRCTAVRCGTFSVRPILGRHFGSQKDRNWNPNLDFCHQNR